MATQKHRREDRIAGVGTGSDSGAGGRLEGLDEAVGVDAGGAQAWAKLRPGVDAREGSAVAVGAGVDV